MSDVDAPDLDAELLALADGDSSDGEREQVQETIESPPATLDKDEDLASQPKKAQKKPLKKKAKKVRRGSSEEEGEASEDDNLDSAAMSESDADVGSPSSDTSGPMFPIEGKYYSEKDKLEVLAMPEIEREELLAERAILLERKQQNTILNRLAESSKADKSRNLKKRKAAADLEDGERKSSRQRTLLGGRKVGETNSAMEAYKAQREQKGKLAEQRRAEAADIKAGRGNRDSPGDSEADADGESEVEWDDGRSKQSHAQQFDEPAELVDFNRVMIGRANFARVCFYPGFERTVKDCYVRVNMGPNPANADGSYRMAKIISITETKPYAIEGPNGKKFITSQHVRCAVGKTEQVVPFIYCSMSRLTEQEYAQYKSKVTDEGQLLPRKNFLISKINQINALIKHHFTEEELQEKLRRSGVLKQKADGIERQSLMKKREDAERRGDREEIDSINDQLEELKPPRLSYGTFLYAPVDTAPKGPTQQARLAEINRANRKANTRDVRKALLAEQRAKMELRRAVERGEANPDPFARVNVQPKIYHDASRMGEVTTTRSSLAPESNTNSRAATPGSRGVTPKPEGTPNKVTPKSGGVDWAKYDAFAAMNKSAPGAGKDENGEKKNVFKRKMCDDEILANMDFGIDEDLLVS